MRGREPNTISFSTEALLANLLRLKNEWEAVQASRNRDAIYQYLSAVFETVVCWAKEGKAVNRAQRALHLRGHHSVREPEPFAAVIFARPIVARSIIGRGANGRGCCATQQNSRTRMSRCGISSSDRAVSTCVRSGLHVAWGEVVRTAVLVQLQKLIPPSDASVAQAQSFAGSRRQKFNRSAGPRPKWTTIKRPPTLIPGATITCRQNRKTKLVNLPGDNCTQKRRTENVERHDDHERRKTMSRKSKTQRSKADPPVNTVIFELDDHDFEEMTLSRRVCELD